MIKKQFEEERVYFTLQLSGKAFKIETDAEECCLLASPHDLLGLLSYTTQNYLPRSGTGNRGIGPSTSITNQKNVPEICLKVNLEEAFFFFQFESPLPIYFSSMCQIHIKLAHTEGPGASTPQFVATGAHGRTTYRS